MKMWVHSKPRKDGKFKVVYGFDSGARFNKIKTRESVIEELQAGFGIVIEDADFDNTIKQAMGRTLFYEF